jgi:rRNA maturation endonuclease Nob1
MSGIEDIKKAIELHKQFPEYLRPRWTNIILAFLSEGDYSINEIARTLGFNYKKKQSIYGSIKNLKFAGRVRRRCGKRFRLIDG